MFSFLIKYRFTFVFPLMFVKKSSELIMSPPCHTYVSATRLTTAPIPSSVPFPCPDSWKFQDAGVGRVERRRWVNFQCLGVLLVWMTVGQGPIALAVGAGGGCLDIFSLIYHFSFLSLSLWETARYRLKYCLKGPLNPKQPTNQPSKMHF